MKREVAVKHKPDLPLGNFSLTGLPPATEFTVSIISVCVFETLKTESDPESLIFQTCPGKYFLEMYFQRCFRASNQSYFGEPLSQQLYCEVGTPFNNKQHAQARIKRKTFSELSVLQGKVKLTHNAKVESYECL